MRFKSCLLLSILLFSSASSVFCSQEQRSGQGGGRSWKRIFCYGVLAVAAVCGGRYIWVNGSEWLGQLDQYNSRIAVNVQRRQSASGEQPSVLPVGTPATNGSPVPGLVVQAADKSVVGATPADRAYPVLSPRS